MKQCIRAAIVAVLVFCSSGVWPGTILAQGNVDGTTYTSPHYDYQIQWSSPWFYIEDSTEGGSDFLIISDGASQAVFAFTFDPTVDAQGVIEIVASINPADLEEGAFTTPPVVTPLLDDQGVPVAGGDAEHAWAGQILTTTLDDGSSVDIIVYFDVTILPGGVVLLMSASAPSYFYDASVLQSWKDLADTALVSGVPAPAPTTAPEPTAQPTQVPTEVPAAPPIKTDVPSLPEPTPAPTLVPSGTPGEPAPAFAAGPWRIATRAVDTGESIDYLGLGFIEGNEWVAVYADVTNWSATDAALDVTGVTLTAGGVPVAPDLAATQSAAALLGLEPANGTSVQVPAGGSTRIVLVYSIPVTESDLVLSLQGNELPLADAVGRQLDVTDPATIATPPAVQEGVVGTIPLDGAVQFFVDGTLIKLAGVGLPSDAGCADASEPLLLALGALSGQTVWLEADPAVSDANTYYVWVEDESGNRVLLNQTLIADGLATEGDLPENARFGAWIEQTEANAQAAGAGIWSTCAG